MNRGLFEILEMLDDYIRESEDQEEHGQQCALLALGFVFGIATRARITTDDLRRFLQVDDDERDVFPVQPPRGLVPLPLIAPWTTGGVGREFRARTQLDFRPTRLLLAGSEGSLDDTNVVSIRIEREDGERLEILQDGVAIVAVRFTAAFGAPFLFAAEPLRPGDSMVVELDRDILPGVSALVLGVTLDEATPEPPSVVE